MPHRVSLRGSAWLVAVSILLMGSLLPAAGCASGGGGVPSSTPTLPPPTATATPHVPRHALAWFKQEGSEAAQVWASVDDTAVHQVTHLPASTAECRPDLAWSPPIFSPNFTKILAALGSASCTDGWAHGNIQIIDALTGAVTPVPAASEPADIRLALRQTGWIDNSRIWWMSATTLYMYKLGTASSTPLGTIGSITPYSFAEEGVLRGHILFFSVLTASRPSVAGTFVLKRFDLTTHTVLPGKILLGSNHECVPGERGCLLSDASAPGFDAFADGAHVVYQRIAPTAAPDPDHEGVASSEFFFDTADGGGASRIASYATARAMARLQLAPTGRLVAVARAEPVPSVFTASVSSPGARGDPDLHFYTPDARSYAVWAWDSGRTFAAATDVDDFHSAPSLRALMTFAVGAAGGTVVVAGGVNPWYSIGS